MKKDVICQDCGSENDVIDFYFKGKKIVLCIDCRQIFGKRTTVKVGGKKHG